MQSLNPHGKIVDEIYMPKGINIYKEECLCVPDAPPHWNVVYQETYAGEILGEEIVVGPTSDETLVDFVMNIITDEELQV